MLLAMEWNCIICGREKRNKPNVLLFVLYRQDNARLSADNANLTEKLASSERANGRLIQELDGVSLVNNKLDVHVVVFTDRSASAVTRVPQFVVF